MERQGQGRAPNATTVVLLAEDWLQIARPFLPRTEDYEKSFMAMLRHPRLYEGSSTVPFAHMADALSRLERYQELPEAVVTAMVADDEFVRRFRAAEREEDARELIELKAVAMAGETIAQNEALREQLDQVQHQVGVLQENLDTLRDARDAAARETESARTDADRMRGDAEAELRRASAAAADRERESTRRHEAELTAAREEATRVAAQARVRQKWTVYWAAGTAFTLLSAVLLATNWASLSAMQRALAIAWVFVAWLLLLTIPKGANIALAVTAGLTGLLGWVATTYQFWVQPPDRPSQPPASSPSTKAQPPAPSPRAPIGTSKSSDATRRP